MSDAELDRSYTALCAALGDVGPERSELLLAMLALGLMAAAPSEGEVQRLLARAREHCLQD